MKEAITALVTLCVLTACSNSPEPARTRISPGTSEASSERDEVMPNESSLTIEVETSPTPEVEYQLTVELPAPAVPPEPTKEPRP